MKNINNPQTIRWPCSNEFALSRTKLQCCRAICTICKHLTQQFLLYKVSTPSLLVVYSLGYKKYSSAFVGSELLLEVEDFMTTRS